MRVPLLPETIELRLDRDKEADGPVFVYRPLTLSQSLDAVMKFAKAREEERVVHFYADLFRAHVVQIRNRTFGEADEPFDPTNDAHINALAVYDVIEIGSGIWNRAELEDRAAGK